jgi:hypothetical protein
MFQNSENKKLNSIHGSEMISNPFQRDMYDSFQHDLYQQNMIYEVCETKNEEL